jgi:hypothetical protein
MKAPSKYIKNQTLAKILNYFYRVCRAAQYVFVGLKATSFLIFYYVGFDFFFFFETLKNRIAEKDFKKKKMVGFFFFW